MFLGRSAALRAGLRRKEGFSSTYPAFTPQRALRASAPMPGYYQPSLAGLGPI